MSETQTTSAQPKPKQYIGSGSRIAHSNNLRGKSRYAKKRGPNKHISPVAPKSGPVKEYISACCSAPARKPALVKQSTDKKSKEVPKGLGHWRCSICGKPTKVTPRKPEPKAEPVPANNVAISVEVPSESQFTTVAD